MISWQGRKDCGKGFFDKAQKKRGGRGNYSGTEKALGGKAKQLP